MSLKMYEQKQFPLEMKIAQDVKLLTVDDDFVSEIERIAKSQGFPEKTDEFVENAEEQYYDFHMHNPDRKYDTPYIFELNENEHNIDQYQDDLNALIKKYNLSHLHKGVIDLFIKYGFILAEFGFFSKTITTKEDGIDQMIEGHERKELEKEQGYMTIKVYPNTSKEEVTDEWRKVQRLFKKYRFVGKEFSMRERKNIDRDYEIYTLKKSGKSAKETAEIINASNKYKEVVIYSDISGIIKRLKESSQNIASQNSDM